MPYINESTREKLDSQIEELMGALCEVDWNEGSLNYVISRIVGAAFAEEPRYHTIARITGVLDNVREEFYRRIAAPYEDQAIEKNGDIPEYTEDE